MTRARGRALLVIGALAAAVAIAATCSRKPAPLPPRPENERPRLLLLTSLPLMFGEGFSVNDTGSPAIRLLSARYRVVPISVAATSELSKGRLLLMAQPRAQPAEDLVALDAWVRGGGRVLLLADPLLEWPSERPLGDAQRPPPMFMDTGLLAHWGLQLDAPDVRGVQNHKLGGHEIATVSPGKLRGSCKIAADGLVARCTIGTGQVIVVADADLLDAQRLGASTEQNLQGIIAELASLERR